MGSWSSSCVDLQRAAHRAAGSMVRRASLLSTREGRASARVLFGRYSSPLLTLAGEAVHGGDAAPRLPATTAPGRGDPGDQAVTNFGPGDLPASAACWPA